ncbi:MAG: hypothetical protein J1D88_08620 [Treponema sp.]|nr:hypothetical protein [Treponema sp.]
MDRTSRRQFFCALATLLLFFPHTTDAARKNSSQPKPASTEPLLAPREQDGPLTEAEQRAIQSLPEFRKNQPRFDDVLLAAKKHLAAKSFEQALETYLKADTSRMQPFELGKEAFRAQSVAATLIPQVEQAISAARKSSEAFIRAYRDFSALGEQFQKQTQAHEKAAAQKTFSEAERVFATCALARNTTAEAGWEVRSLYDRSHENGIADASWLFSVATLICGYENRISTGIVGAMDSALNETLTRMKESALRIVRADLHSFVEKYPAGRIFDLPIVNDKAALSHAQTELSEIAAYAGLAQNANGLYKLVLLRNGDTKLSIYKDFQTSLGCCIALQENISSLFAAAAGIAAESRTIETAAPPPDSVTAIRKNDRSYVQTLQQAATAVYILGEGVRKTRAKWLSAFEPLSSLDPGWNEAIEAYGTAANLVKFQTDSSTSLAMQALKRVSAWYADTGKDCLTLDTEQFEKALSFAPNAAERLSGREESVLDTTPSNAKESISLLQQIKTDIATDKRVLQEAKNHLGDKALANFSANFINQQQSLTKSIEALDRLLGDVQAQNANAQALYTRSLQFRADGDMAMKEARAAFSMEQYQKAMAKLEEAAEHYDQSLRFQDDPELKKLRDSMLVTLGEQISHAKYETVIHDIRELKTNAENAYYSGSFEQAQGFLNRADALWKAITVEEDEELENLKALVNTALTMNEGRYLLSTYSNYPEMSQILSTSRQYFEQGHALILQGKTAQAKEAFANAKNKLRYLQRSYPRNQDAKLLTLRIDQLLDRETFDRNFATHVNELKKVDFKKRDSVATTAYLDLQDLYAVNPGYPGLSSLIQNAEYDLNLRKRPVPAASVKRSDTMMQDARKLVAQAGSDSAKIEQARAAVQQVLQLNPANSEAKALLDELKIKQGGQDPGVLSSEDEQLYRQASYYYRNNYISRANEIMAQLWAKESNRTSTKVSKLKRWIDKSL